jgi:hypothetical protein
LPETLYYPFRDLLGWNVMEAKDFRFFVAALLRMTFLRFG